MGEPTRIPGVACCYTFRARLQHDFDIAGVAWRQFAAESVFSEMSHATLCDIYHGAEISLYWRRHYGLVLRHRDRRIAVSAVNVDSAIDSLFGKRGIQPELRDEFVRRAIARNKRDCE